ncbi:MAG: chemotaxis protein CheD [Deltaproteobacteria bacterium]|nr:chemotaxis protein CheD [Deltaproteobacteria bacterium]
MPLVVSIAEMQVSPNPDVTLVTYALGSCIAVALHDPVRRAGGMIHYMLPTCSAASDRGKENPVMFGDTGIPLLFESMYALGCRKADLLVYVAGGAQIQDNEHVFNIGKRNYTLLRKIFWKNNVIITAEHVGGDVSRTLSLDVGSGRVRVRIHGAETLLSSGAQPPFDATRRSES